MEANALREVLDEMDYRASCKRFCDDIDQRLDKVKAGMAERAIWELFQNAGDVAREEDGKKAYVKMTLTPTEFLFAHKGKPFTYDTLNSLVKQVSSQSKEDDEDATGQYGTGFVTTHSFGKVLTITSSMEKPFSPGVYIDIDSIKIDRSYNTKTEFYEKMPKQLLQVKDLALYGQTTTVVREWTELRYQLSTAIGNNGLEKALRGFDATIKTLPFLMTINPKIAEVDIDNQVIGNHIKFSSRQIEDECGLNVMLITSESNGIITTQKIYYIASETRDDVIILPLASPFIPRRLDGISKLFVNYPLIGTEDFGFEYIFHSRRFIPVEERNGLYLPEQEANSPQKHDNNVIVLNEMVDMLFSTLEDMVYRISSWEEILNLGLDAPQNADSDRLEFYKSFKQRWVSFYESLCVFEIGGVRQPLSGVRLYSEQILNTLTSDTVNYSDSIYQAAEKIGSLPSKELISKWSKVVSTWYSDSNCFITIEDIAERLSVGDVDINVILEFDRYLNANELSGLFDDYRLIPNRDGNLMYGCELRDASTIPDDICMLVSPFISDEIEMFVDERFVDINKYTVYTRNDLRKALNDALDSIAKETFKNSNNPKPCDKVTLEALAKISLISRTSSHDTYRASAMKIISEYIGVPYELNVLPAIDAEEKDIARRPFRDLVENLLLEISTKDEEWIISNSNYIFSLHQSLSKWAEYYSRNDDKGLAVDYACFPNMLSQPSMARNLRKGADIPEKLFDLYQSVMDNDLRSTLVSPDYSDFYEFVGVDASDIAKEIEDRLEEVRFDHDAVLDIIEQFDKDGQWEILFPHIAKQKADLFMKQVKSECKDGIFRLMKVNNADILNQLAELAKDCDMDEIIRLGRKAIFQSKNEKASFEYKKSLGEYVEAFILSQIKGRLETSLAENSIKVEVNNLQGGQDIVIFCCDTPIYYLEVKSRWGVDRSVEMSPLQLSRCVAEANHYALLCLNMAGTEHKNVAEHIYPSVEETISKIKAITNIGILAVDAYNAVSVSEKRVHLGGGFSCIVPQSVIDREGKSFSDLIECIISKCVAILTNS